MSSSSSSSIFQDDALLKATLERIQWLHMRANPQNITVFRAAENVTSSELWQLALLSCYKSSHLAPSSQFGSSMCVLCQDEDEASTVRAALEPVLGEWYQGALQLFTYEQVLETFRAKVEWAADLLAIYEKRDNLAEVAEEATRFLNEKRINYNLDTFEQHPYPISVTSAVLRGVSDDDQIFGRQHDWLLVASEPKTIEQTLAAASIAYRYATATLPGGQQCNASFVSAVLHSDSMSTPLEQWPEFSRDAPMPEATAGLPGASEMIFESYRSYENSLLVETTQRSVEVWRSSAGGGPLSMASLRDAYQRALEKIRAKHAAPSSAATSSTSTTAKRRPFVFTYQKKAALFTGAHKQFRYISFKFSDTTERKMCFYENIVKEIERKNTTAKEVELLLHEDMFRDFIGRTEAVIRAVRASTYQGLHWVLCGDLRTIKALKIASRYEDKQILVLDSSNDFSSSILEDSVPEAVVFASPLCGGVRLGWWLYGMLRRETPILWVIDGHSVEPRLILRVLKNCGYKENSQHLKDPRNPRAGNLASMLSKTIASFQTDSELVMRETPHDFYEGCTADSRFFSSEDEFASLATPLRLAIQPDCSLTEMLVFSCRDTITSSFSISSGSGFFTYFEWFLEPSLVYTNLLGLVRACVSRQAAKSAELDDALDYELRHRYFAEEVKQAIVWNPTLSFKRAALSAEELASAGTTFSEVDYYSVSSQQHYYSGQKRSQLSTTEETAAPQKKLRKSRAHNRIQQLVEIAEKRKQDSESLLLLYQMRLRELSKQQSVIRQNSIELLACSPNRIRYGRRFPRSSADIIAFPLDVSLLATFDAHIHGRESTFIAATERQTWKLASFFDVDNPRATTLALLATIMAGSTSATCLIVKDSLYLGFAGGVLGYCGPRGADLMRSLYLDPQTKMPLSEKICFSFAPSYIGNILPEISPDTHCYDLPNGFISVG